MFTTDKIIELIRSGRIHEFYNSRGWRNLAKRVKKEQRNECQDCKTRGRYTPANIVHHEQELKKRPDLAYERTYTDAEGNVHRQLTALCFNCHERRHNRAFGASTHFRNAEKW